MKISIHDYENNRTIISEVPLYLIDDNAEASSEARDDIAQAIITALGLSSNNCEYMIGDFDIQIDVNSLNSNHGYNHNVNQGIEQLTQDFKEDVLEALND